MPTYKKAKFKISHRDLKKGFILSGVTTKYFGIDKWNRYKIGLKPPQMVKGDYYTITHLTTGLAMPGSWYKLKDAKMYVDKLIKTKYDWSLKDTGEIAKTAKTPKGYKDISDFVYREKKLCGGV